MGSRDTAHPLRPYQAYTVAANETAWAGRRRPTGTGIVRRTTNVLATGLGKTHIAADLALRAHGRGERTIMLVDGQELANQAMRKMHSAVPHASIGLVKASGHNEWDADIVVASVPSIGREDQMRRRGIPADRFGLGMVDECHHSAADTWRFAMDYFSRGARTGERAMPWAGFSATLARQDNRGLGEIWDETVAEYDISFGVREGWLVPVRGRRVSVRNLRLEKVRSSRGDFADGDLGDAMEAADTGGAIARAYLEHTPGRRAVLFAPTVPAARHWAQDMNDAGIRTEVITGKTTAAERVGIYARFEQGVTLCLASVMVLTEGWDAPWAEVAIMARPTQSLALYVQCVGRVLRPFPGKRDAMVLDVIGTSARHRLVNLNDLGMDRDVVAREDGEPDSLYDDDQEGPGSGELPDFGMPEDDGSELVSVEVSLFDESDGAWNRTDAGLWYVATAAHYFYLWPQPDGGWSLGRKPVHSSRRRMDSVRLERDLTLEGAMAWGTKYAAEDDVVVGRGGISSRSAAWRSRKPTERLVAYAAALGVSPVDGAGQDLRQGEMSDRITQRQASDTLPLPPGAEPVGAWPGGRAALVPVAERLTSIGRR